MTTQEELGLPMEIELTPLMVAILSGPRRVLSVEAEAAIDRIEREAQR